jgi:DnaJ-class molecular chaperone
MPKGRNTIKNGCLRPGVFDLRGQGMPFTSNPNAYGDTIIEFEVEYPNELNSFQQYHIKQALLNH